eukprot:GEMP01055257.1.p1 GENE.GEMP01055257.1~~GEMP01055257.1.p1  ORF type:complete len:262 (+),score=47.12 GEMP01055257.1:108-788(+)
MSTSMVTIASADGVSLAATVWNSHQPAARDAASMAGVVLVHQWGKMGGSAQLMEGMARQFTRRGFPALTFDLRGIGSSTGCATFRGYSEVADIEAACTYAKEVLKWPRLLLLGSSAGAPMAGSALPLLGDKVDGFIGIGYVCGRISNILFGGHIDAMVKSPVPKLLFHGDSDGFSSIYQVKKMMQNAEKWELEEIKGVGHFEIEGPAFDSIVAEKVVAWAKGTAFG